MKDSGRRLFYPSPAGSQRINLAICDPSAPKVEVI
jgi:hypothetical protein